jgi:hypothetical protein
MALVENDRVAAWHGMAWQGNGMGAEWERHGRGMVLA